MHDDADFEEILPARPRAGRKRPAIEISTVALGRHGAERLQISFSLEVAAKLQDHWPRFQIGYSPNTHTLRIRSLESGPFEAIKTPKGERHLLRIPLPAGLRVIESREPGPQSWSDDGKTLYLIVPPVFRWSQGIVQRASPPGHVAQAGMPAARSHRDLVAEVARAIPAPPVKRRPAA